MKRAIVLNTRPRDQAAELSRLLRDAGCEPVEMPATDIVPAWDPVELSRACGGLARRSYSWLVLQSQNAAHALPTDLRGVNILCGAATARALQIDAAETLQRFSATAAQQMLRPLLRPGERVLVPRAAEGRDELVDGLRALSVQVDAPIAYRTQPVSPAGLAAIRQLRLDAITFCSPSAVRAVVAGVGPESLREPCVVCLGPTTADAARQAGLRVDAIAAQTSMPSLVAAVMSALGVAA
jgi:uroporphyrinogen-III synthase